LPESQSLNSDVNVVDFGENGKFGLAGESLSSESPLREKKSHPLYGFLVPVTSKILFYSIGHRGSLAPPLVLKANNDARHRYWIR
jgi:hypothetical protein